MTSNSTNCDKNVAADQTGAGGSFSSHPHSEHEIYEKICLAMNTRNVEVLAPYLPDHFLYIKFGTHPFISEKSDYLEFLKHAMDEATASGASLHADIQAENGVEKPFVHSDGKDWVYDVEVENGLITKILRRPPYSRFTLQNPEEEFPMLLQTAGSYLNDYFTQNVTKQWCWIQTAAPELTFQDFCIAYDNYVLCIVVGWVRQTFDKDPEVLMSNQKMENLLRVCEQNNMTPCLCLFDTAGNPYIDGCPLIDARTYEPLDLEQLTDDNEGKMSAWELQNLGVRYIFDRIQESGYTDAGYCDLLEISPQIFFRDQGAPCYVIMRSIPIGLADEKFTINAQTLESVKHYKGYFVDLQWAALMGGTGLYDDKFLYRTARFDLPNRNRSNLANNGGQMVDIEKAIKEYPFIEIVEN